MGYALGGSGRDAFRALCKQTATITVTPVSGAAFSVTEANIRQGGLTIDRFSVPGQSIEVGACTAAEMTLTLDNTAGTFDGVVFEGAQMVVTVSCSDGVNTYSVPMGYFTVDEAPKMAKIINIVALDRMVQFDKDVDLADFTFPITVEDLVTQLCTDCNVVLSSSVDLTVFPNYDFPIEEPSEGEYTYRQFLSWACQMLGVCAYMDWAGELRLEWYHTADSTEDPGLLKDAFRFASTYEETPVSITGMEFQRPDGTLLLAGTDGYVLDISDNIMADSDPSTILSGVYSYIGTTDYVPFDATVVPMPWIYPMDKVWFYYTGDTVNNFVSYVTNVTFTLNGRMGIKAKGVTTTQKGWASANPLTNREQVVIRALEQKQSDRMDEKTLTILQFNDLITNALGLYSTTVPQPGGGNIYHMHNEPVLEDSMVIFTGTSGGIAWTDTGWNGGSPVWQYGVTSAGSAFFKVLAADRVIADWVKTGILQSSDGTSFYLNLDTGELNMDVSQLKLNGTNMDILIQGAADAGVGAANDVQDNLDELKSHIVIGNDGSMTFIGASGNPITLKLTNNAVEILNGSTVIDTFGAGGTTTENLTIPNTGSLTMYPYKWVSRSNGHLQLVFVG